MQTTRDDFFLQQANLLLGIAQKRTVTLRLLGALAFRVHCPIHSDLFQKLSRSISDIDFAGYSSQSKQIREVFHEADYVVPREALHEIALSSRMIFTHPDHPDLHIDVFLDQLQMCHLINFRGRLELDSSTLPLSDMLLEKLQIAEINEKDIKDCIVLLREHELGDRVQKDTLDIKYIASLLANDWGFYHTATSNLRKIADALGKYANLTPDDRRIVTERVESLQTRIEQAPKSLAWKLRAKVGTKVPWYNKVEEVRR